MMNKLMNIRSFLILITALVAGIVAGCSEKSPGGSGPEIDGNLVINIERSPSEVASLVDRYILTVSGPDMETVVDTARSTADGFVVFDVEVPVGDRRLFVLEGISGNPGTTVYRGETVAPVIPGAITTLDLVMRPVVPMIRVAPVMVTLDPSQPLELRVEVFNIPNLSAINIDFLWNREVLGGDLEVELDDRLGPDVRFYSSHEGGWMSLTVADTLGGVIVNQAGNGVLAHISLQPTAHAGLEGVAIFSRFVVDTVWSYTVLSEMNLVDQIFYEDSEVWLLPLLDRIVQFPDAALDRTIRNDYLDSLTPEMSIMLSDVLPITYISVDDLGVADLTGIQNMINLRSLDVSYNPLENITPVAPLTRLSSFSAESCGIQDVAPLTSLTNLSDLYLSANWITDIGALSNLTNLYTLELNVNQITDITPLADKPYLRQLRLGNNQISDISVLADLPYLYRIGLSNNLIEDIGPLLDNPGLGTYDIVELWGNPAPGNDSTQLAHIDTLRARGVTVYQYEPGQ